MYVRTHTHTKLTYVRVTQGIRPQHSSQGSYASITLKRWVLREGPGERGKADGRGEGDRYTE